MSMLKEESGYEQRELPPVGPQLAVCYAEIGLGQQKGSVMYPNPKWKTALLFETSARIMTGDYAGQRFGLNIMYTLSSNPKSNLFRDIKNWLDIELAAGMDLEEMVVGKLAVIKVVHKTLDNNKVVANITSISAPMAEMADKVWVPENGKNVPGWKIPAFLQKMRENSLEKPEDFGCEWEPEPKEDTSFDPTKF